MFAKSSIILLILGSVLLKNYLNNQPETSNVNWYNVTGKYQEQTFAHDGQLSSLTETWQRELAALWRLETDVNNGGYLQFLGNWGKESYTISSQALKKIGANKMAQIIDRCQSLVDEHFHSSTRTAEELKQLMPNPVIDMDGKQVKEAGSVLPDEVLARINELSYEFMAYPENISELGLAFYGTQIEADGHVQ